MFTANLFSTEVSVKDLLSQIPDLDPDFSIWASMVIPEEDLEKIIRVLIKSGLTSDATEALAYLNRLSQDNNLEEVSISYQDLTRKRENKPLRRLRNLLSAETKERKPNPYRFHGIASHQAIHALLTGKIPDYRLARKLMSPAGPASAQLALFKGVDYVQDSLFEKGELTDPELFSEVLPGNMITAKLSRKIELLRGALISEVEPLQKSWVKAYLSALPMVDEFSRSLKPVFSPYIESILNLNGPLEKYLALLTLLSWSWTIDAIDKEKRVLFKEVPVLSTSLGLSAGRLDALEVTSINGIEPSPTQKQMLSKLSENRPAKSTGALAISLSRFGKLDMAILDWKFAVGDAARPNGVISASDVAEPIKSHATQLKRYITMANLDYHLQCSGGDEAIWDHELPFNSGRLVYFLPFSSPVTHEIKITPEEQEEIFIKNFADRIKKGEFKARLRLLNNYLVGHVINCLSQNGKTLFDGSASKNGTSPLPQISSNGLRLREIARRYTGEDEVPF